MSILKWAVILASLCGSTAAMAQDKPVQKFTPTGPWAMDYGDNSCRLIREFSDGKEQLTLAFERFSLEPELRLGLTGSGLHRTNQFVALKFGDEAEQRGGALAAKLADGRTAFLLSWATLIDADRYPQMNTVAYAPKELPELLKAEIAVAGHISAMTISQGFETHVSIDVGPMAEPVKALQRCANDLFAGWGIDIQRLVASSRRAEPANDWQTWVTTTDYPSGALAAGANGIVNARLVVDEHGAVARCMVDVAGADAFELAVCKSVRSRAKFRPALDAEGKPISSYWRGTWHFYAAR